MAEYDGSLKFDTAVDSNGFNSGIANLGKIAKTGMAVLAGAIASGVTAFGTLSKASLESVAKLEQNMGGVETLFKDSADTVISNAKRAYETAGMSANNYMETVTSFSASLLQSLGGDTVKAAEYADRAIIDMSDNANKMGTSMELIQNAYQGFAKQNYTMLDNLKLGYGGTKEEMNRLIKDAAALNDVQKKLGITVDANSMSFGNIVNAISVMQESMGIAGTTAKEAMVTIEGSVNAAKAAWDNFLNGTISAEKFADVIGVAAGNIIDNLGMIVPRLAETVPEVVGAVYEQFSIAFAEGGAQAIDAGTAILSNMMLGVAEALPGMVDTAVMIINSMTESINANLPALLAAGGEVLLALTNGVITLLPTVLTLGQNIITTLWNGLQQNAPQIIAQGQTMFSEFCNSIRTRLPEILAAGTDIINNLLTGLLNNAPNVIAQASDMLVEFVDAILDALPAVLDAGADIILNLLQGLVNNAPKIFAQIRTILINLISTIVSHLPEILQKGIEIINKLRAGIIKAVPDLIGKIPSILKQIGQAFMNTDWAGVGIDIIKGIAAGIANGVSYIISAAKSAAKSALDAAKSALGIKSPSRVFRDEVGKYMALGVGVGFEKNMPVHEMTSDLENVVKNMQQKVGVVTKQSMKSSGTIIKEINDNYTGTDLDYNKMKEAHLEALNEANERPVVLNKRDTQRTIRDWGLVPE